MVVSRTALLLEKELNEIRREDETAGVEDGTSVLEENEDDVTVKTDEEDGMTVLERGRDGTGEEIEAAEESDGVGESSNSVELSCGDCDVIGIVVTKVLDICARELVLVVVVLSVDSLDEGNIIEDSRTLDGVTIKELVICAVLVEVAKTAAVVSIKLLVEGNTDDCSAVVSTVKMEDSRTLVGVIKIS